MRTIGEWIRLSIKKNFIHPANGFFVIVDVILDCLGVWVFWMSLQEMGAVLKVWNGNNILIFMGMSLMSTGVSCLFVGGYDLEEYVIRGNLDFYLIRPLHGMVLILGERANFLRIFLMMCIGGGMLSYGFKAVRQWELLFPAIIMCILATCLVSVIELCFRCLCFWFGRVNQTVDICSEIKQFASYPITLFSTTVQTILIYVVPVGMCATIPAQVLIGEAGMGYCVLLLVQCILIILIYCTVWKKGVSYYDSAN